VKKSTLILTIFSIAIFSGIALAEDQDMEGMDMMEGKGMKGKGMMGGKGMMHQQPTVVATSDGGIVVLQGPKLAKYDASLNLVNEVELKGGPKKPPTPMTEEDVAAVLGQAPDSDPQAQ